MILAFDTVHLRVFFFENKSNQRQSPKFPALVPVFQLRNRSSRSHERAHLANHAGTVEKISKYEFQMSFILLKT